MCGQGRQGPVGGEDDREAGEGEGEPTAGHSTGQRVSGAGVRSWNAPRQYAARRGRDRPRGFGGAGLAVVVGGQGRGLGGCSRATAGGRGRLAASEGYPAP
ncbi:hypothetical protein GCM10009639_09340 [Kitasatospora putterlickiae]|uniref:Uncharacterized protein n=1 Tax=Kitasatospora putterlickiae TaxID=221725 RepID=A0ABN1XQX6_9ACTN